MLDQVQDLLLILIGSSLVSNVVLSQFLGLCPFLGVSKKVETAAGMGTAVIFVITLSSAVAGAIYKFALVPLNITYLQTIVFILVIAALVQFVEMVLKKYMVSLYNALGVYLPLITTNCAVLGVAITNVQKKYGILTGTVNGFATALGFTIAIIILAGIREKMAYNDVPESFKGNAHHPDYCGTDGDRLLWFFRTVTEIGGGVCEYIGNSDCYGNRWRYRTVYRSFSGRLRHPVQGGSE